MPGPGNTLCVDGGNLVGRPISTAVNRNNIKFAATLNDDKAFAKRLSALLAGSFEDIFAIKLDGIIGPQFSAEQQIGGSTRGFVR